MTNALVKASQTASLPAQPPPLPEMTRALASAVSVIVDPFIDGAEGRMLRHVAPLTPEIVAEAREALAAIECDLAPARLDTVRAWLMPIAGAVRNPTADARDFERLVMGVAAACDGLPWWAFNRQSLRAGLARFQFLPSAADVLTVLTEHVKPTLDALAALRRLANARPAPPRAAPEMTPEQRAAEVEAVAATLTAWRASTGRSSIPEPERRPRPAYLLPEQLAAVRANLRKGAV